MSPKDSFQIELTTNVISGTSMESCLLTYILKEIHIIKII